jgi:hypothetical protein
MENKNQPNLKAQQSADESQWIIIEILAKIKDAGTQTAPTTAPETCGPNPNVGASSLVSMLRREPTNDKSQFGEKFHMYATALKAYNRQEGPCVVKGIKLNMKEWEYLVEDSSLERRWILEKDLVQA